MRSFRRLRVGWLLIAVNVGLVLAAMSAVLGTSARLLRRLADEQALARVELAGATAAQLISHAGERVRISTALLAERPPLGRLLAPRDAAALSVLLERFAETSRLSGCAVLTRGQVVARGGEDAPWAALAGPGASAGGGFLAHPRGAGRLLLGAVAPLPADPTSVVVAMRVLDPGLLREISGQVGLDVRALGREEVLGNQARWSQDPSGEPAALRARAVESERPAAAHLEGNGRYVAAVPLKDPSGAVIGIVEAALPSEGIAARVGHLNRRLVALTLGVAGIVLVLSVGVARGLVGPLERLSQASDRIGRGDLTTPIPPARGREIGTLAERMDGMRARLVALTAELRRRQAEADAIVAGIAEGVFSVDRERRIRYMNRQAAALLGIRPEEAVGRFCGDVLNPRMPDGERPCDESCPIVHARSGGAARATEHLVLRGGARRSVVISSAPPDPGDRSLPGAPTEEARQSQMMRDETEIEAARRLRDAVIANVSHEFKTPLSAQLASIELLLDRLSELSVDEVRDLVLSLQRGSLRLTHLIDNLLESVRIDAGRDEIRRRPVALDEVIEEAVELIRPLTAQRGQILDLEVPFPLPPVEGDAPRLVQVLVNLLANSVKFAPSDSTIAVGGSVTDDAVVLWVRDEGPGFSAEVSASLFSRFARTAGDEEPEQSGMGLGLWLVKSIVERHGGRVEARNAERGAQVSVVLPRGTVSRAASPKGLGA